MSQRNRRVVQRCASTIVMEKIGLFFSSFVEETRETRLLTHEEKLAVLVNT
jgi:hypothetical protein